jgi:hypothetical protein
LWNGRGAGRTESRCPILYQMLYFLEALREPPQAAFKNAGIEGDGSVWRDARRSIRQSAYPAALEGRSLRKPRFAAACRAAMTGRRRLSAHQPSTAGRK